MSTICPFPSQSTRPSGSEPPRKPRNITGRDGFIIGQALFHFIATEQQKPDHEQRWSDLQDTIAVLLAFAGEKGAARFAHSYPDMVVSLTDEKPLAITANEPPRRPLVSGGRLSFSPPRRRGSPHHGARRINGMSKRTIVKAEPGYAVLTAVIYRDGDKAGIENVVEDAVMAWCVVDGGSIPVNVPDHPEPPRQQHLRGHRLPLSRSRRQQQQRLRGLLRAARSAGDHHVS